MGVGSRFVIVSWSDLEMVVDLDVFKVEVVLTIGALAKATLVVIAAEGRDHNRCHL